MSKAGTAITAAIFASDISSRSATFHFLDVMCSADCAAIACVAFIGISLEYRLNQGTGILRKCPSWFNGKDRHILKCPFCQAAHSTRLNSSLKPCPDKNKTHVQRPVVRDFPQCYWANNPSLHLPSPPLGQFVASCKRSRK